MMHGGGASCDIRVQYACWRFVFSGTILFESTLNGIGIPFADKQVRAAKDSPLPAFMFLLQFRASSRMPVFSEGKGTIVSGYNASRHIF
jgi:hypothetical protein